MGNYLQSIQQAWNSHLWLECSFSGIFFWFTWLIWLVSVWEGLMPGSQLLGRFLAVAMAQLSSACLGYSWPLLLSSLLILTQEMKLWHRQAFSLDFILFPLSFCTAWTSLKWTPFWVIYMMLSCVRVRTGAYVESLCVVLGVRFSLQ